VPRRSRPLPLPDEAMQGSIAASDNAHDLLEAARGLHRGGLGGPAASLLVLALEEAEKARALTVIVTGDDRQGLSDDELRDILYGDHRLRHNAAFTESLSQTTLAKLIRPSRRQTPIERKQYQADMKAMKWHMEANSLKQRGLYVDFVSGRWQKPSEVSEKEFTDGLAMVQRFIDITARRVNSLRVGTREQA
jgi:AbiV family abortive infection protein